MVRGGGVGSQHETTTDSKEVVLFRAFSDRARLVRHFANNGGESDNTIDQS
jgi:hypothetical protein